MIALISSYIVCTRQQESPPELEDIESTNENSSKMLPTEPVTPLQAPPTEPIFLTEETAQVDIPLIKPKMADEDQEPEKTNAGLFSLLSSKPSQDEIHAPLFEISSSNLRPSTPVQHNSSKGQGALIEEIPSLPKDDAPHETVRSQGFKPIIQVVSSKDSDSNPSPKTFKTVDDTEREDLTVGGNKWATNTKPSHVSKSSTEPVPLLIEEIEDDDFEERHTLHETEKADDDEDSAVIEAGEALSRLQATPTSQLSSEDKVWQLAAKGGSTLEEDEVGLDQETKNRLKVRLNDAGMLDKVSLHF